MRNHKKKAKPYTEEQLLNVIEDVKAKRVSLNKGAKILNISADTLRRKIATPRVELSIDRRGKKTVLSPKEEEAYASYLKTLTKWGFGLSRVEVVNIVSEYCKQNNIVNPFKNGIPGQEWFQNFCLRNDLKLKNTEPLEKCRQKNTADPFLVYEFYDILEKTAAELDVKDRPEHWYNLDESGINHDPTRSRVVAGKKQKDVYRTNQGSGKENTTVMGCVSAAGRNLPPLFVFKALKLWSTWKGNNDIPGSFYSVSESGFINSEIFFEYFKKICTWVTERPLILLCDGHVSHLEFRTIEFAKSQNVSIVKLPSHTTDVLQPLDKSCFGPLKQEWNRVLLDWQRKNQRVLQKSEFVDLVCEVWDRGLSALNIIAGFRSCGIFPLDRNKYPVNRFTPAKLQEYLASKESAQKPAASENTVNAPEGLRSNDCVPPAAEESVSVPVDSIDVVCASPAAEESVSVPFDSIDVASSVVLNHVSDFVVEETIAADNVIIEDFTQMGSFPSDGPVAASSLQIVQPQLVVSFEDLLLKKVGSSRAPCVQRKMIPSNAAVITSEQFSEKIKEIHERSKNKKQKGKKSATSAVPLSSATEDGVAQPLSDSANQPRKRKATPRARGTGKKQCSDKENATPSDNIVPDVQPEPEDENTENFKEGDYILAKIDGSEEVCRIDTILLSLEEAVVVRFKKVTEQTFEMFSSKVIQVDDVVRAIGSPIVVDKGTKFHYVFPLF